MKKIIFVILFVFIIASIGGFILYRNREAEKTRLKQKYEPLININLDSLKTMPFSEMDNVIFLMREYEEEIKRTRGEDEYIKSLVPNLANIERVIGKRIAKKKGEKYSNRRKEKIEKQYLEFLKEVKGIKDEDIIKKKLEKLYETNEVEEDDKEEFYDYIIDKGEELY